MPLINININKIRSKHEELKSRIKFIFVGGQKEWKNTYG